MEKHSVNPEFKENINRFKHFDNALLPHGLAYREGRVVDATLPEYMNRIVCSADIKKLDPNKPVDLDDFPEIKDYIKIGRKQRIAAFQKAQAEATAWHNR